MRKLLLSITMVTFFGFWVNAQVIENFEGATTITLNTMANGHFDVPEAFEVIDNPDVSAVNPSAKVCKFTRAFDGNPWAGFWSALATPIDLTTNKYMHVKVWKPRLSPTKFKIEGGAAGNFELTPMNEHTLTGAWEELVFYFEGATGTYPTIVFRPDFEDPVTLTEDIFIYFDDIELNDSPNTGTVVPEVVIENYEGATTIAMNTMANGHFDVPEAFEVIDNPDVSAVNPSAKVAKFTRAFDGNPWAGFWSALATPIDFTTNKYMHVKVWKPRLSPTHFKIEGGAAGNFEITPVNDQTLVNQWEELVFFFETATGTYPTVVLMPDFADPVNLTEDILIYFDDIILNNNPNTSTGVSPVVAESLKVFPSHFNNNVNVYLPSSATKIVVSNMMGAAVMTMNNVSAGTVTLSTQSLSTGMYFISVYSNGTVVTRKAIKI